MLFTDNYTRMAWVTFIKEKSKAFMKFKAFKALVKMKPVSKLNV